MSGRLSASLSGEGGFMSNWLRNEIIEGIQRLTALRLRNCPGTDLLPGTVEVWFDVISSRPVTWDQRLDSERIKTAFRELCATIDHWPTPADLIRVMPPRKPALMLTYQEKTQHTPETKKMLDDLIKKLTKNANQKTD
jgi:hypothetical protein